MVYVSTYRKPTKVTKNTVKIKKMLCYWHLWEADNVYQVLGNKSTLYMAKQDLSAINQTFLMSTHVQFAGWLCLIHVCFLHKQHLSPLFRRCAHVCSFFDHEYRGTSAKVLKAWNNSLIYFVPMLASLVEGTVFL